MEAVRCRWFESYRGQEFFVISTYSVFLGAGLAEIKHYRRERAEGRASEHGQM